MAIYLFIVAAFAYLSQILSLTPDLWTLHNIPSQKNEQI